MAENLNAFFDSQSDRDWKWKGKEEDSFYSLVNGRLRLNALNVKDNELNNISNLLIKEVKGKPLDVRAKLKLKLKEDKDMVGISVINDNCYCIIAEKNGDATYLKQVNYDKKAKYISDEDVVYKSKIREDSDIYFEIKINEDGKILFYFGYSADDIYKLGFSSDYTEKDTLRVGIFSINADGKKSEGYAKFEYVRFY